MLDDMDILFFRECLRHFSEKYLINRDRLYGLHTQQLLLQTYNNYACATKINFSEKYFVFTCYVILKRKYRLTMGRSDISSCV